MTDVAEPRPFECSREALAQTGRMSVGAVGRFCTAAVLLLAIASCPAGAQTPPDDGMAPFSECEVIARANSEVILACELDWQVRLMFDQRFGRGAAVEAAKSPLFAQAREQLIKRLIVSQLEMALLYSDFRSNAPQADLDAIKKQLDTPFQEQEIKRLMEMVGVEDREELDSRLFELGTSLGERREEFYRTMIARTWLTQSTSINREVTHEQMLEYYHEHEADYHQPERARWEELMVRFDKHPSKRAAYAAAAQLGNEAHPMVESIAADKPAFAEIAKSRSDGFTAEDGGLYDWTSRGALAAEAVDKALFSLPVGQMSPILEGTTGFHIVRILERREAGPTPFREVQAEIKKTIRDERFNAQINKQLTKLKQSARLWTAFTGDVTFDELRKSLEPPQQAAAPGSGTR